MRQFETQIQFEVWGILGQFGAFPHFSLNNLARGVAFTFQIGQCWATSAWSGSRFGFVWSNTTRPWEPGNIWEQLGTSGNLRLVKESSWSTRVASDAAKWLRGHSNLADHPSTSKSAEASDHLTARHGSGTGGATPPVFDSCSCPELHNDRFRHRLRFLCENAFAQNRNFSEIFGRLGSFCIFHSSWATDIFGHGGTRSPSRGIVPRSSRGLRHGSIPSVRTPGARHAAPRTAPYAPGPVRPPAPACTGRQSRTSPGSEWKR